MLVFSTVLRLPIELGELDLLHSKALILGSPGPYISCLFFWDRYPMAFYARPPLCTPDKLYVKERKSITRSPYDPMVLFRIVLFRIGYE